MAIRDVVIYPNPVLREKCADVVTFDADLETLISDMYETMDSYNGIGLAAPQIGLSQRLLVVGYQKVRFPLINPEIISKAGSSRMDEGCLSLPDILVDVERAETVTVKSHTVNGETVEQTYSGLIATIIQHEMDHLDGKLIIDYGPPKPITNEDA
jgi:peptide deformylase